MDAALRELTKLEKYTDSNSSSIHHALNSLLQALQDGKAALLAGQSSEDCLEQLATAVEAKKKEIDERQKELYTILSRLGKALDKVHISRNYNLCNSCIDAMEHCVRNFQHRYHPTLSSSLLLR
jgi:hypothetical protein